MYLDISGGIIIQLQSQIQKMEKISEEARKLDQELMKTLRNKKREFAKSKKKFEDFEKTAKNKEVQINIFAVMYMTLYEKLKTNEENEEEKQNEITDKLIEMTKNFIAEQTEPDKIEMLKSYFKLKKVKVTWVMLNLINFFNRQSRKFIFMYISFYFFQNYYGIKELTSLLNRFVALLQAYIAHDAQRAVKYLHKHVHVLQ